MLAFGAGDPGSNPGRATYAEVAEQLGKPLTTDSLFMALFLAQQKTIVWLRT
jgi:hypothetical protein